MTIPASNPSYSFPEIADYTIVEQLYLGSRTAVYRAVTTEEHRPDTVLLRSVGTHGGVVNR